MKHKHPRPFHDYDHAKEHDRRASKSDFRALLAAKLLNLLEVDEVVQSAGFTLVITPYPEQDSERKSNRDEPHGNHPDCSAAIRAVQFPYLAVRGPYRAIRCHPNR
jgi:hypothetical protein